MPQSVQVEDYGTVLFPDEMSEADIQSAIDRDVLPRLKTRRESVAGRQVARDLGQVWNIAAGGLGGLSDYVVEPTTKIPAAILNTPAAPVKAWTNPEDRSLPFHANEPAVPQELVKQGIENFIYNPASRESTSAGIVEGAADVASGFTTPENLLVAGGGVQRGLLQKAAPAFIPGLAQGIPEEAGALGRAQVEGTPADVARAATRLAANAGIITHIGAGPEFAARGERRYQGALSRLAKERDAMHPGAEENRPTTEANRPIPEAEQIARVLEQGGENAVREQESTAGVLRPKGSEVELPRVGARNAEPQVAAGEEGKTAPAETGKDVLPSLRDKVNEELRKHGVDPETINVPDERLPDAINSLEKFGVEAARVIADEYGTPLSKHAEAYSGPAINARLSRGDLPVEINRGGKIVPGFVTGEIMGKRQIAYLTDEGRWSDGVEGDHAKVVGSPNGATPTELKALAQELGFAYKWDPNVRKMEITPTKEGEGQGHTFYVDRNSSAAEIKRAFEAKIKEAVEKPSGAAAADAAEREKMAAEAAAGKPPETIEQLRARMRGSPLTPETPKRRPPQPIELPQDILHAVLDTLGGGKISLEDAKKYLPLIHEELAKGSTLDKLFSRKGGRKVDELAQEVDNGLYQGTAGVGDNPEEFLRRLLAAPAEREAIRERYRRERDTAKREMLQKSEFDRAAIGGERLTKRNEPAAGEPVLADDLTEGTTFKVSGEEFEVTKIDADGITVDDGERFGTQKVAADQHIRPDEGTLDVSDSEASPGGEEAPFYRKPGKSGEPAADVFKATDRELDDILRGGPRAPKAQPGEAGKNLRWRFRTYDDFKAWMDERYAERDMESMREAYTDVDVALKKQYIKDNRKAADHKRNWINHIAAGADLAKDDPPIPRKTMPKPPAGMAKPPSAPPTRPGQPPPPPRGQTPRAPFTHQALVQLLRAFGSFPRVNKLLRTAYGRFVPAAKAVEVANRLMWDVPLALRVLSHEIGHFVDLAISPEGSGRNFAKKWQPLRVFKKRLAEQKELTIAAKQLSAEWRGPFSPDDRYRNSASELFADVMSAILTKPELVNQKYPLLHDTFQELIDSKPSFKAAYDDLTTFLKQDKIAEQAEGQLDESFKRSVKEFAGAEPPERIGFTDLMKKWFITDWFRAEQKEREHRIGHRISDELEDSRLYAARKAQQISDRLKRTVQPFIDKIQGGGEEGWLTFNKWLFGNRIIEERRASTRYLETHPDEAYDGLKALLDRWDRLREKFGPDLDRLQGSTDGAAFYDLAGRIFREIHDMGETGVKQAQKILTEIDDEFSGVLTAYNVRGRMLNPSGFDVPAAGKLIQSINSRLSMEERIALEHARDGFFDMMTEEMSEAHEMGLISAKDWYELVQPNLRNYVPFAVLDKWDQRVGAGIRRQHGTAKDIAAPYLATQLKIGALNNWKQRQMQTRLLMDIYSKAGYHIAPGERVRGGELDLLRKKNRGDETSRLPVWVDGKMHVVEFPDDRGHTLEHAAERPGFLNDLATITNGPLGRLTRGWLMLFTTLAPTFTWWNNAIRDFRTSAERLGHIPALAQTATGLKQAWKMSRNYARGAFGEPLMPEVQDLINRRALQPSQTARAFYADKDILEGLLVDGGLTAMQVSAMRPTDPFHNTLIHKFEKFSAAMEALPKIQTEAAARRAGLSPETAAALARRAGIPNPAVGGSYSGFLEVFMPWTRVHIQGIRSTLDVAKDPGLGKAFMARVAAFEMAPRLAKFAIAQRVINNSLNPQNKDDTSWQATMGEFFRRMSPYKMAIGGMMPIAWYDPRTGEYHKINSTFGTKAGDIPKHWYAVSFRMPSSEEGRLWGALLYNMLSGIDPEVSRAGKGVAGNIGDWLLSQGLPGANPSFKTGSEQFNLWIRGVNPQDSFRGGSVANEEMFKAGGTARLQANTGSLLNNLGDAGALAGVVAQSLGIMDPRALSPNQAAADKLPDLSKLPILKGAISYDNYAQFRDKRNAELEEQKYGARAKLLLSDDQRMLYDFYNKNSNPAVFKTLDPVDRARYAIARNWHNYVWGQRDQPNRFYARALAAVGTDGSGEARKTVKADLEQVSKAFIDQFRLAPKLVEGER